MRQTNRQLLVVCILALLCIVGCGGVPPDYYTARGIAVFNDNGNCPQDTVQQWEDEAVDFWSRIYWVDPVEDLDAEVYCSVEEMFTVQARHHDGRVGDYTAVAYQVSGQIYLGSETEQYNFFHELSHFILETHSDIPHDNNIEHMVFYALGIVPQNS